MGAAMGRGMVLVMSLWDDGALHILWLDSNQPADKPASTPGVARGPCSVDSGAPSDVRAKYADSYVSYTNMKYGEIGSTINSKPAPGPTPGPTPRPGPTPPPSPGPAGG